MNAPRNFAEMLAQWEALRADIAFVRAQKNLEVITAAGKIAIKYGAGATNCVLDLRSLSASGAPPSTAIPDQADHADEILSTDGATPSWVAQTAATNDYFTHVRRTTTQSIANGVAFVQVSFDTAIVNGGLWSAGAPTLFTIPVAGLWFISGWLRYNVNATGVRYGLLQKNSFSNAVAPDTKNASAGVEYTYCAPDGIVRLVAGDTIRLNAYQDSGGALDLTVDGVPMCSEMTAMRLTA